MEKDVRKTEQKTNFIGKEWHLIDWSFKAYMRYCAIMLSCGKFVFSTLRRPAKQIEVC